MKVTLITGASGGIGEAFARRLAKEKHNLLLVARSENKLKDLCRQLSEQYAVSAQYIAIDLSLPDSDAIISEEVAKRNLQVDWLINNAGVGTAGDLLEYTLEDYQRMMRINMEVMVALTYRFLPPMRTNRNGTIINVGSMAGFTAMPYMTVYTSTKKFVQYFTQGLWEENRHHNIRTMLLCPGATKTGFLDAARITGDRRGPFFTQNAETPEQVVESAMKGLQRQSIITISGFGNKAGRVMMDLIPTRFGLKMWGNIMRKNLKLHIK